MEKKAFHGKPVVSPKGRFVYRLFAYVCQSLTIIVYDNNFKFTVIISNL